MEQIIERYKNEKCINCLNKNKKIEEDKCEIRTYHYNNYLYCRCCNMNEKNQELKQKII